MVVVKPEVSTMADLQALLAQRSTIDAQIRAVRASERAAAIATVRTLMSEHGLTPADIAVRAASAPKSTRKVAPKYRDPDTGSTWSGRGLKPKWLTAALAQGRLLETFAI